VSENRTLPLNPAHIILGCYCGSIVIRVESFDPGENVAMISSLKKKDKFERDVYNINLLHNINTFFNIEK